MSVGAMPDKEERLARIKADIAVVAWMVFRPLTPGATHHFVVARDTAIPSL
jgi:hypothetical protein